MTQIVTRLLPGAARDYLKQSLRQLRNFRILAGHYGQWRSMRLSAAVDGQGAAIPWYTYPALEFLQSLHTEDLTAFEFGSGNSSIWWSQRVKHLTSVEDNEAWFSDVSSKLQCSSFQYLQAGSSDYAGSIARFEVAFDIVIIDGICRPQCAEAVVAHISKHGGRIVILDNSDWYPATCEFLTQKLGWVRVDMNGFGPINGYSWTTSIWIDQARMNGLYRRRMTPSLAHINGQCAADREFERVVQS